VAGGNKRDKETLEALYDNPSSGELRVLTMNWEALQSKRGFEEAERFANTTRRLMIVCDESDAIKNPSAARTKALMKLKKFSHWRRIMSGTPINNAPFDAFSQFTFLDETILRTTSFYAFKAEYAEMLQEGNPLLTAIKKRSGSRFTPQVVARGVGGRPKYRNLDKLSRLIAPHSFRVLKKDCLDLPEKIYKTLVFSMTREQIEVYKKAEEECRIVFENEETPFNKLVAVTKLAQITSGYYIHPLSEEPVRIEGDNPKLDLLVERVERIVEQGDKVIVWARYRIEIEDIVRRLQEAGIACVQYHGGIGKDDRTQAIEDFERGGAQVFVGNQQAGGTGITLVAASYVIYFSNNFSLRDRLQSEDRAHRIGQTRNVTYVNIVAKGTIDEAVVKALSSKKDVADTIIDKGLALFS
jgi:SNF2 family DNA or RNA helicase